MSQVTYKMWIIGIAYYFCSGSISLLKPFYLISLGAEERELFYLLLFLLVDFPALLFSYMVIDSPEYGRVKLLSITSLVLFIVFLGIYIGRETVLIAGLVISYFLRRITNLAMYTIVVESYHTQYRSKGLGMYYTVCNCFGALAPFFIFPAFRVLLLL